MSARERPTWVEVDHAALRHNLNQIQRHVGPDVSVIGVGVDGATRGRRDVHVGKRVREVNTQRLAQRGDASAGGLDVVDDERAAVEIRSCR